MLLVIAGLDVFFDFGKTLYSEQLYTALKFSKIGEF